MKESYIVVYVQLTAKIRHLLASILKAIINFPRPTILFTNPVQIAEPSLCHWW